MYGEMTTLLDSIEANRLSDRDVIGWGCPVPYFGHLERARLATVGINPSNREFVGVDGAELVNGDRRLPTLRSLGLTSWGQADHSTIVAILSACSNYFESNPYDGWFQTLERIIEPTGHSFYAPRSDACHLDVVPWATRGKWGRLLPASRQVLVARAARALASVIDHSELRMLVLNGQEVVRQFEILLGHALPPSRVEAWDLPRKAGRPVPGVSYLARISEIDGAPLDREIVVAGYNHNLQSSFGVTTIVLSRISEWLAELHDSARW